MTREHGREVTSDNAVSSVWDERYRMNERPFGTEPSELLVRHLDLIRENNRVLTLGEGDGRHALWLLERRDVRLTAVDASAVALERLKRRASETGRKVVTVVADLATYDTPLAAFDVVLWFFLHMPKDRTACMLREAFGALRPGGHLIGRAWTSHGVTTPEGRADGGMSAAEIANALPDAERLVLEEGVSPPPRTPSGQAYGHTDFVLRRR